MQFISICLVWSPTYNVTNIVNKAPNRPNFKMAILEIASTNFSYFYFVTAPMMRNRYKASHSKK